MTLLTIQSRGFSVEIDTSRVSDALMDQAALHGLKQKIADSAAGAKKEFEESDGTVSVGELGKMRMQSVVDSLVNGEWGVVREGGASVDPIDRELCSMIKPMIKKAIGAEKYKVLSAKERNDSALAKFAEQSEDTQSALRTQAQSRIDARKIEKTSLSGIALEM